MTKKNDYMDSELFGCLQQLFKRHKLSGRYSNDGLLSDHLFESETGFKVHIDIKSRISARTIERYDKLIKQANAEGNYFLLISQKISQSLIDRFSDNGIQFFSPDGASRIEFPGFTYIVKVLLHKQEKIAGSSGTVFVGKAAMIPRVFLSDPQKSWRQFELAEKVGVTRGYVSIVIRKMVAQDYIVEANDEYQLTEPDKLLDDWTSVYRFDRFVRRQMFAMNSKNYRDGLKQLADILQNVHIRYAFMGNSGAFLRAPYMEPGVLSAYVSTIPEKLDGLYPVAKDGNVVLYVPANEGYFLNTSNVEGMSVASDVQLYLDLKRMPGRSEDQAEYLRDSLMDWSKNAEQ